MFAALLVPVVAVSAGTALSVIGGPRPRVLLPIRGFALAAVVTSVVAHLVPEAMMAVGVWALLAFAIGLWLPLWLSHLRRDMAERGRHRRIASELGFAAVLLHQLGDGVALGALGTSATSGGHNWDILIGIFAHTVPLAAVVTLPFVERGLRVVALRAALLVAASAVGATGVEWLGGLHADLLPWLSAAVAGTLLHILSHDEPAIDRPASLRLVEVAAMLAGAAMPAVLSSEHELEVLGAMGRLALALAPVLALGLCATILLRAFVAQPQLGRRPGAAGEGPGVLAGLAAALRAPSCACEVTASAQVAAKPSPAQLAFLLIAPELHVGTLMVTAWLFGGWWAALRALLAVVTAWIAVGVLRRIAPGDAAVAPVEELPPLRWTRLSLRDQIAESFVHAAPWLAAGIVVATWLVLTLPEGALVADLHGTTHGLWQPAITAGIAVLTYVCAWAATPVAAVLVAKGLAPELAIAGLVIGTITNREVLSALGVKLGRGAIRAVAAMVAALSALGAALLASGALSSSLWPAVAPQPELPRAVEWAAAGLLIAGALLSLWRYGLAAWLEPLLADGSGHHHHQHEETEPCRDGCHDALAEGLAGELDGAVARGPGRGEPGHGGHGHGHGGHGHGGHAHHEHAHREPARREHAHRDHLHHEHARAHREQVQAREPREPVTPAAVHAAPNGNGHGPARGNGNSHGHHEPHDHGAHDHGAHDHGAHDHGAHDHGAHDHDAHDPAHHDPEPHVGAAEHGHAGHAHRRPVR